MDPQSPPPPTGGWPFAPPGLDPLRIQTLVLGEIYRLQRGVLEALLPRPPASTTPPGGTTPTPAPDDPLYTLFRRLQLLLLLHPIAAQSAFAALLAEGREFAKIPDGQRWAAGLSASETFRRAGQLWEALGLGILEDDPNTVLPSTYLEALMRALNSPELAALAKRLRDALGGAHVQDR